MTEHTVTRVIPACAEAIRLYAESHGLPVRQTLHAWVDEQQKWNTPSYRQMMHSVIDDVIPPDAVRRTA